MKSLLIISAVVVSCLIGSALSNIISERLYQGKPATAGQFPYQALLIITTNNGYGNYSGGVIIDQNYILTAGRNCYDVKYLSVLVGITKFNDRYSTRTWQINNEDIFLHEKYDPATLKNNICIFKMPEPIELDKLSQPVGLPDKQDTNPSQYDLQAVTVSGWGVNEKKDELTDEINFVNLMLLPSSVCKDKSYKVDTKPGKGGAGGAGPAAKTTTKKGTDELCTYIYPYAGPCTGDVGDPMTIKKAGKEVLIGLVSRNEEQACRYKPPTLPPPPPVVYIYVPAYLDWIKGKMT